MLRQRVLSAGYSALIRAAEATAAAAAANAPLTRAFSRGLASSTSSAAGGSTVKELSTVQEYEAELRSLAETGKLGVIDFTAKWCGPCKFIAPYYDQLSQQYPQVAFFKIDIDNRAMEQVVVDHGITGVPTFTFYKGRQKIETFSGARLDMLKEVVQNNASE